MKTTASRLRRNWFIQCLFTVLMMPGLVLFPVALHANPSAPTVITGGANFSGLGTGSLTINQSTNAAIINWGSFSIGANEVTRFVQPGQSSIAINRVTGINPSVIAGQLRANGGLMLINQNGIMVTAGGVIDVGGALTLSTLDASNQDLLNGGSTRFTGSSGAGVVNYGLISGQDVIFMGNYVNNLGGITAARAIALGAGSDMVVEQTAGGATISVRGGSPGSMGVDNSGSLNAGNVQMGTYARAINNSGTVRANGYKFNGGRLTLSAGGRGGSVVNTGNLYARRQDGAGGNIAISAETVDIAAGRVDAAGDSGDGGSINMQGTDVSVGENALIIADGTDGGSVNLDASGGNLNLAGTVSSRGEFGDGGNIDMTGAEVAVAASAVTDASGFRGGRIRTGGGYQGGDADITNAIDTTVSDGALFIADGSYGDGGEIIVWADNDTLYSGDISAQATGATGNGGFVEVSGKRNLSFDGTASTLANNGQNGTLLLDPEDILIARAGTTGVGITVEALVGVAHGLNGWNAGVVGAVATGLIHTNGNVIVQTNGALEGTGNITIGAAGGNVDDIHYISDNSLTFLAHGSISVNSNVLNHKDNTGTETGHLNLVAGWNGDLGTINTTDNIDFAALSQLSYGTDGSILHINSAGRQEVSVGSRAGETNALSNIVLVTSTGTRESAQLGYRNYTLIDALGYHSSGDINVRANNYVGVITNFVTNGIADGHAMIGHGGQTHQNTGLYNDNASVGNPFYRYRDANFNTVSDGQLNNDSIHKISGVGSMAGDISVKTDGALEVIGSDDRSFAQIGHGGLGLNYENGLTNGIELHQVSSTRIDPSTIDLTTDFSDVFDIVATTTLDEALGVDVFGQDRNDIDVGNTAGIVQYSMIRIGGPGGEIVGVRNIDNFTRLDLERRGLLGSTIQAYAVGAQIDVLAVKDPYKGTPINVAQGFLEGTKTGNITVEAQSVNMRGGQRTNNDSTADSWVQIGHGGLSAPGVATGDIAVISKTSITGHGSDFADNSWNTKVQIGHGGTNSGAYRNNTDFGRGFRDQEIDLLRSGSLNGNGGAADINGLGHRGAILVEAQGGDLTFLAGIHTTNYAQIGHGGYFAHGNHNGDMVSDGSQVTAGNMKDGITVSATGNVILDRLDDHRDLFGRADNSYVQIGMGGAFAGGRMQSNIDVDAGGNLEVHAGAATRAYGQIGNGGMTDTNGGRRADGDMSGDIDLDVGGNLLLRAGAFEEDAYAQIGNGGRLRLTDYEGSAGDGVGGHNGDITIDVAGSLTMEAGSINRVSTQVGYNMISDRNYAMIGNGGHQAYGNHYGNIVINSGGTIKLESFIGSREYNPGADRYTLDARGQFSFAQIGHGGGQSDDARTGWNAGLGVLGESNIDVNAAGSIQLLSANQFGAARSDIMVPQLEVSLDFDGDGDVDVDDETTMDPVQFARDNYTQIGHGGSGRSQNSSVRQVIGNITVNSGGDISLSGGRLNTADNGQANLLNDITTLRIEDHENDIVPVDNYSRIGHLGMQNRASTNGNITVNAAGSIDLLAGNGRREMAVIGSGGYDSGFGDNGQVATRQGDITVTAGVDVDLQGSLGLVSAWRGSEYSYAQIGNDMVLDSATDISNITVRAGRDVLVVAGTNDMDAYAQIGSGGIDRARVNITSDIDVTAGGNVLVIGDEGSLFGDLFDTPNGTTYAKIGHGSRVNNGRFDKPFNVDPNDPAGNTIDRNPIVGDRNQNQNNTSWNGNIYVKAGEAVLLDDGFIGHVDGRASETNISNVSGDTFIASNRLDPLNRFSLVGVRADDTSGFSSAGQGILGDLRFYMPNRSNNAIEAGAGLNGIDYIGTPGGVATLLTDQNPDENLDFPEFTQEDFNFTYTGGNVEIVNANGTTNSGAITSIDFNSTTGSFTPEGPYSTINGVAGFYQLYYNNLAPETEAPTAITEGPAEPPIDVRPYLGFIAWEAFDLSDIIFEFDGYGEGLLGNLGAMDGIEGRYIPRSALEEILDASLGSRRGGLSTPGYSGEAIASGEGSSSASGPPSDAELEFEEDQDRMLGRALNPVGKNQNVYFLHNPAAGQYSSFRVFGVPSTFVPAFSGQ